MPAINALKKPMKALHELGAIGVTGSFAVCLILFTTAPKSSLNAYVITSQAIATIAQWLLVPSLALVLLSGLLAMIVNSAYLEAGWAWLKALLGIGIFEGTLQTVVASARRAAELSVLATSGHSDPAQLSQVLRTESNGLKLLLVLCLGNIVLGIWRPTFNLTVLE
jgi:hypothetical protein